MCIGCFADDMNCERCEKSVQMRNVKYVKNVTCDDDSNDDGAVEKWRHLCMCWCSLVSVLWVVWVQACLMLHVADAGCHTGHV